jgi:hypothetical protein
MLGLKQLRAIVAASAFASVSAGCVSTSAQFHDTGGQIGQYADQHLMAAESNQMALYRFTVLYALLSEAASQNKTLDPNDAIALNLWMHRTDKDIFRAYRAVYPKSNCASIAHQFSDPCWEEAPIYDGAIEDDLLHLAHFSLPAGAEAALKHDLQTRNVLGALHTVAIAAPQVARELEFASGVVRSSDMTRALALALDADTKLRKCNFGVAVPINRRKPESKDGAGGATAQDVDVDQGAADTLCVPIGVSSSHIALLSGTKGAEAQKRKDKHDRESEEQNAENLVNLAPWGYDIMYHGVLHACDRLRSRLDESPDGKNVISVNKAAFCQFYYSNMRLNDDHAPGQPDLFKDFGCFPNIRTADGKCDEPKDPSRVSAAPALNAGGSKSRGAG